MPSTEVITKIGCSTIVAAIQQDMVRLAIRYPHFDWTFARVRHSRIKTAASALQKGNALLSADIERVDAFPNGTYRPPGRIYWKAFGETILRSGKTQAATFLHKVANRIEELKNGQ